jgi:hypothetical protein
MPAVVADEAMADSDTVKYAREDGRLCVSLN